MVVVNYKADAKQYSIENDRQANLSDPKYTYVQLTSDVEVSVSIEMTNGHVNLDAYTMHIAPDGVADTLREHTPDNVEIVYQTIESSISGGREEWIRAARRWVWERPEEGDTDREQVENALERFAQWEDTHGAQRTLNYLDDYTGSFKPLGPSRDERVSQ